MHFEFLSFFLFAFIYCQYYDSDQWHLIFIRYFKRELLPKGAIDPEKFPSYFASWIQKGSDQCIYSPLQLKRYSSPHLAAGCWYLDCIRGFVVESEAELKAELDARSIAIDDSGDGSDEAEGLQDQSSAPPPKKGRGRRLRKLGATSQGSQETGAESSAPEKGAAVPSPVIVVPNPSPTPAPSSVSASAITRGLLEQRKARLLPASTSSAGTLHSTGVSIIKSSVTSLLIRNMELKDKGGHPDWVKTLEFVRKV
jgi:hypothetical protein